MFFYLSKFFYFFLSPFVWLLIFGVIYIFTKSKAWKKWTRYGAIFTLLFFSNTFILKEFIRLWEIPSTNIEKVESVEFAVVLGGMFNYDNSVQRLSIRRGGDRIWQALNLYHDNKIQKIFISGDNGHISDRGLHEADQIKEVLLKWGYPEKAIWTESNSRNTYENAKETVRFFQINFPHIDKVLLITSATHMRRASACFEKLGFEVIPFSTDQYTAGKRSYHWDEFLVPSGDTFREWTVLLKEWVGMVAYKMMGYA